MNMYNLIWVPIDERYPDKWQGGSGAWRHSPELYVQCEDGRTYKAQYWENFDQETDAVLKREWISVEEDKNLVIRGGQHSDTEVINVVRWAIP